MPIKILPKSIYEKIAAGEVVERPMSVVKELVENSIDAGATSIAVEIADGGISLIRVTDNGSGMNKQDATASLKRHATSKISEQADLENISTMGFRGEALFAISAICELELKTRQAPLLEGGVAEGDGGSSKGTILTAKAGEVTDIFEAETPEGTTFIIKNLFYNTPARMKFLKSNRTESSYIEDCLERLAMSHQNISFKFTSDGKQKFTTNGNGNLSQVIYAIYGAEYAKNIEKIDYTYENIHVTGVIGNADLCRSNKNFQTTFVNGRYVKSWVAGNAVEEAHKSHLMVGKHPFFVLNIELPFNEVDINVHPAKTEVKFANEGLVYKAVYWAIKNVFDNTVNVHNEYKFPSSGGVAAEGGRGGLQQVNPLTFTPAKNTPNALAQEEFHNVVKQSFNDIVIHEKGVGDDARVVPTAPTKIDTSPENYKIIGQAFNTYIILEQLSELILIDQHAAHERKIYENLITQETIVKQPLLGGVQVSLSATEMEIVLENIEAFDNLGIELDQLNDTTIVIRTNPIDIEMDTNLILELIGKISGNNVEVGFTIREEMLHSLACKAAIKGNNSLSNWEMKEVADWVLSQNERQTCPHGRPLTIKFTKYELEKLFKRVTS